MNKKAVYKNYDQQALDLQYNNRFHVPGYARYMEQWETLSRQTEKECSSYQDLAYGEGERERLDIYPASKPRSRTCIFIHGGYWRSTTKSSYQFVAKAFLPLDITTVIVTYPLAPEYTLDQVVHSCRKAVRWIQDHISDYRGNPDDLHIIGHSAGGHLAAMMLTEGDIALKPASIRSVISLSGLFNLIPIQRSDVNESLRMDETTALRNSPVQLDPVLRCPVLLAVGAEETDEFRSQGSELYQHWKDRLPVEVLELPGINHYSILEYLLDSEGLLYKTASRFIGFEADS